MNMNATYAVIKSSIAGELKPSKATSYGSAKTANRNGKNRGTTSTREKPRKVDQLIVAGFHKDDFEWAARQYEETGYVLVAFLLDRDGYH